MATVTARGPLFDSRLEQVVEDMLRDATHDVAAQGLSNWHQLLDTSIRHPTPYYETQITSQRTHPHTVVVHDRGIVYGPWLEGVGSRNRTTRFKGYFALRRAVTELHPQIPALLDRVARHHVGRLR